MIDSTPCCLPLARSPIPPARRRSGDRRPVRRRSAPFAATCAVAAIVLGGLAPAQGAANFQHAYQFGTQQALDSGFLFPYGGTAGGVGYGLGAFWTVEPSEVDALLRFDGNGAVVGNVKMTTASNSEDNSLFPVPNILTQFLASRVDPAGFADVGRFNFSDRSAVFTKRIFLVTDPNKAGVTYFPVDRVAVVQDGGQTVRVSVFDAANGNAVFEKVYSSTAFLASGGLPGFASQTATLHRLPDLSGFVLVVTNNQLSFVGENPSFESNIIVIRLGNDGAVGTTTRFQMSGGTTLVFPSASVCADNSVLVNLVEQTVDPVTDETTTKNRFISLQTNGQVKWQTLLNGAQISPAKVEAPNGDLYFQGLKAASGQSSTTSDGVLVRLGSSNGGLLGQALLDCGPNETVTISGVDGSGLYATVLATANQEPPFAAILMKIGLDLASVSQAVEYARGVTFGFMSPDPASGGMIFSTMEGTSNIGAISLNANLGGTFGCPLFSPVAKTLGNPGITAEASALTPATVVVESANFVSESSTATFNLAAVDYTATDICQVTAGPPVTLSTSAVNIDIFGGNQTVDVTTSAPTDMWTATSNQPWLVVTSPAGGQGQGNGSVQLDIAANTTNSERTANLTVNDKTVVVTQAPLVGQVAVTESGNANLGTGGGSGSLLIVSGGGLSLLSSPFIDTSIPSGAAALAAAGPLAAGGDASTQGLLGLPSGKVTVNWAVTNNAPLANRSGTIRIVDGSGSVLYTLTITQTGLGGVAPVNLSARTQVGTGDNILIPGVVVGGTGKTKVLVRGVGATLGGPPFNLGGVLADPKIELFQGGSKIGENDSWSVNRTELQALFAEIGAFALTSDLDSAAVFDLDPGAYTVQLRGANDQPGVGIVEVYVLDPAGNRGLVNLSARAEVGTGDRVMIPGLVIGGNQPVQVVVRGVGPTLGGAPFNVPGVLEDPVIEVFNASNQSIATNDDWGSAPDVAALQAAFATVGAFPLNAGSADAAVLLTLQPGAYTAVIRGKGNAIGVALIEAYLLVNY